MPPRIPEVEINQIIIEETRNVVQENKYRQGFKALGKPAGGGLLRGAAGFLGKAVSRLFWPLTALELGNLAESWWYGTADPDKLVIMRMAKDETSQKMQDAMLEYSELYFKFIEEASKIIFAPGKMNFYAQFKEYIPSLGLDRLLGGEGNYAPTLTVDYTPNNPSPSGKYRRSQFFEAANKILLANSPVTKSVVQSGPIAAELKNLVDKTVKSEYELIRYNQVSDRVKINDIQAEKSLKAMADQVAKKAAEVNELFRTGVTEAEKTKEQEEVEAGKDPETAKETAKKAVATTTTSRYRTTRETVSDVLKKGAVVSQFAKSSVNGLIGQVQGHLQTAGYRVGKDGYFGPRTLEALKKFQRDQGLEVTGEINKETLEELIVSSIDKELDDLRKGRSLPVQAKVAGQQTESGADNLPFPFLKRKIERLEGLVDKVKDARKSKIKARLDRAKKTLETKLLNYAARKQAKGDTDMRMTEEKLLEIVQKEVEAVLSERLLSEQTASDIEEMIDGFNKLMTQTVYDNRIVGRGDAVGRYRSMFNPGREQLNALLSGLEISGVDDESYKNLMSMRKSYSDVLRNTIAQMYKDGNASAGEDQKLKQQITAISDAIEKFANDFRMSTPKAPEAETSDYVSGKDIDVPSRPRVPAGGAKGAAAPSSSPEGMPADWRRFASASPKHAEMARVWLAATGKLTEAALPNDSSYKAFQRWYSATAGELGRQFGPAEAIKLINQSDKDAPMAKASEPAAEPSAVKPVSSTASVVAMTRAAPAIAKALADLKGISAALKAKKGPTKTVVYDFSDVDGFLPAGIADFGKMMFAKGPMGNRKKAIAMVGSTMTMLRLLKDVIAQGEDVSIQQSNAVKQTASEIKAELEKIESGAYDAEPDEFEKEMAAAGALEESVKNRWQKLIKG